MLEFEAGAVVFSSNVFLFGFLPAVLAGNFLLPQRFRNLFLFLASVFFYLWGTGPVILVFLITTVITHLGGVAVHRSSGKRAKVFMVATVGADLGILLYYKYLNFFADQLTVVAGLFGVDWHRSFDVPLPIGVSFFVFHAITYPVQIYWRREQPAKHVTDVGLYLGLFSQLVAGPILKYSDISKQLYERRATLPRMFYGLQRFSIGLGKKVLIANQMGFIADRAFNEPAASLTPTLAWLGTFSYAFQIYFDFSGYSDMAVGMAELFGFHFPENFNRPYRATSVTDFWRRWHMTLSGWFRDFVYIPLGGNRNGPLRTYVNLFTVFFLCGLWHGAAWHFVVWGMFHGALLVIERLLKTRFGFEPTGFLGTVLTCALVFLGWIFFRASSVDAALLHLKVMLGLGPPPIGFVTPIGFHAGRSFAFFFVCAAVISWMPFEKLQRLELWQRPVGQALLGCASLGLVFYSATVLSTAAFNPFIYFQF